MIDQRVLNDAIGWDIPTWRRAFLHWERVLESHPPANGLELGAKLGGASLFLAHRFGTEMICSDLGGPADGAAALHAQHGVSDLISYADANAISLPYDDSSFDVVVFKSILGSIAGVVGAEAMQTTMKEIRRVLRPGGTLLFAENLSATVGHQFLRRRIRTWGRGWHYLSLNELTVLLDRTFPSAVVKTTGFICVGVPERFGRLRASAGTVDGVLDRVLPMRARYLAFGHARA